MSDFKSLVQSLDKIAKMPEPKKIVTEGEIDYLMVDVLSRINQLTQDIESPRSRYTIGINENNSQAKSTELYRELVTHLNRAYDTAQQLYDDAPYGGE
jgi:hypothetical protein